MNEKHTGPQGWNCPACAEYTNEREACVSCGNASYEEMWVPDCGAGSVCHSEVVKLEQERDRYKKALELIRGQIVLCNLHGTDIGVVIEGLCVKALDEKAWLRGDHLS